MTTPPLLARIRASRPASFVRRPRDLVVAGVGSIALVMSGLVARNGRVGDVERSVFRAINDLPNAVEPFVWPVMQLGNLMLGPVVALIAAITARYRLAAAALTVTVAKLVGERLVKAAVERERPSAVIDDVVTRGDSPLSGQSFVSGHLVLVVGLAAVVTPYLPGRWKVVPWLLALAVGFGRIYVGAHNPLDVVGGAGLGALIGGLTNFAIGVPAPGRTGHDAERG